MTVLCGTGTLLIQHPFTYNTVRCITKKCAHKHARPLVCVVGPLQVWSHHKHERVQMWAGPCLRVRSPVHRAAIEVGKVTSFQTRIEWHPWELVEFWIWLTHAAMIASTGVVTHWQTVWSRPPQSSCSAHFWMYFERLRILVYCYGKAYHTVPEGAHLCHWCSGLYRTHKSTG